MSLRFQADNDLRFAIVKAVRRQEPAIDFASAQEAGLDGLGDPELLERAASEGRVLVSHDRRTMLNHFRNHLVAGKSSPGLRVVAQGAPVGAVADALVTLWAVATGKNRWLQGVAIVLAIVGFQSSKVPQHIFDAVRVLCDYGQQDTRRSIRAGSPLFPVS